MRLSVVIPTFNRAALPERALGRLFASCESSSRRCELIGVDNNSTDNPAAVTARFGDRVRYVFEARQGLSYARNAGIAAVSVARPEKCAIALTEDDVEVAPDWMGALATEFDASRSVVCVGGRVLPKWSEPPPSWISREQLPEMERSRGRILGVPVHLFRSAAGDVACWLSLAVAGDASAAFAREARLWFFSGFVRERCAWLPCR